MYRKQVRRRRAVLALLIVGSFALLTITYRQGNDGMQRGVSTIFSPIVSVADRALKPARDMVNWFDETFDAKGENEDLHSELETARRQAVGVKAALAENEQLRKLVGLDNSGAIPGGYTPVTGRVILRSPTVWFSDVTIDVGSGDGVGVDDPVVNGDGLVGTVAAVTGGTARVTLIVDHSSAVAAKLVPSGTQGLMKPSVGDPEDLILDFLDSEKLVGKGQSVVTSGFRAIGYESGYPPNLPIGEVVEAPLLEQEAQQQVHIKPYADLRNLDLVQVLTGGSRG
ncbi:MAG TPA: rod shape-determining protein MreC [Solirubrobacterales bacterium]|nr:rod shape-determining protein MreC [Solirubrobacterales bacterium]